MVNIFRTYISREYTDIFCKRNFAASVRAQQALGLDGNAIYVLRLRTIDLCNRRPRLRPTQRAQNVRSGPRTNFPKLSEPYFHHRFFSRAVLPKIKFLDDPLTLSLPAVSSSTACIKLIGTAA